VPDATVKGPWAYVSGLLDLHKLVDGDERRATWRQSMATLARVGADEGPSPLEGLHPEALAKGVHAAIAHGLADDLDWLAPPAAAVALYTLAAALPPGPEQKDIGRRAIAHLNVGNAETFCAMATRMALTAGKGLQAPSVRARVALVIELPLSAAVADGPMALALCSSRELAREWIAIPSTGSLPARRLAARILERAAREASKRAQQGDDHAMRVFKSEAIKEAWARLLVDRESLVWRHIAVARGLIAPWVPQVRLDVLGALGVDLTPTEWRRGATSLAAMLAVLPEPSVRAANAAIGGGSIERDPGVAAAFVWGISRAAEAEPEAAASLLGLVISRAPLEAAEAVSELFAEFGRGPFVERAAEAALAAVATVAKRDHDRAKVTDDGRASLEREVARDLAGDKRDDPSVREQLEGALSAFATQGARAAYAAAKEILASARGTLDTLDALALDEDESAEGKGGSMARRTSLAVMRDLDISLLERNLLGDLLKLGPAEAIRTHDAELDDVREHLAEWILARESTARSIAEGLTSKGPRHPTLRLRRLRALLHLVDSDVGSQDNAARGHRLRKRWFRIASAILARFEATPPQVLRRTLFAALARALDALVRADALDVADVFLVAAQSFGEPSDFTTLAEASMDPDLILVMGRYSAYLAACARAGEGSTGIEPSLVALEEITRELFPHTTIRGEALRTALVRLLAALKAISAAPSLKALVGDEGEANVLASLETALASIAKLSMGARARLDPDRAAAAGGSGSGPPSQMSSAAPMSVSSASLEVVPDSALSVEVARVVTGAEPSLSDDTLAAGLKLLIVDVPPAIASVVALVLGSLTTMAVLRSAAAPLELDTQPRSIAAEHLPAWVPARRTLGGFYLVRPLGQGASGSVFLVHRVEDKSDPDAEKFALKVPDYSASAARLLSESEFLEMFRAEASALIAVPSHPNLARFVTFDLAARPKPILVMELVEGATLEAGVQSRALDMPRCFAVLDDVLQGLDAMHSVGVGHLDLKPSNVVLRRGIDAVLVDFGLAGRHIRPGCATGPYGAPEVWGADSSAAAKPSPLAADVYAFGCLAFEALTGRTLFQADNELTQVSMHIAHDGFPPLLKELASHGGMAPLAEMLFWTLRRDAAIRPTAQRVREDLNRLAPEFSRLKWPLPV
jgi:eukaryotic-like serine/threonine-protein kinase